MQMIFICVTAFNVPFEIQLQKPPATSLFKTISQYLCSSSREKPREMFIFFLKFLKTLQQEACSSLPPCCSTDVFWLLGVFKGSVFVCHRLKANCVCAPREVKLRPCGRSGWLLEHTTWQQLRFISSCPDCSGRQSCRATLESEPLAAWWRLSCWLWNCQELSCVAGVLSRQSTLVYLLTEAGQQQYSSLLSEFLLFSSLRFCIKYECRSARKSL